MAAGVASGAASASFVCDGDGRRVKGTVNGVTSYYVGDHYEVSAGAVKKYYSAGGQRIALHDNGTLYWLLTDHLGGTAYTVSGTTKTGELRYRPFGVTRFASGTTPTSYRFTGQREEAALGLYFYNARWYDPALGHFLSPDALVPEAGNALDYHRYAYVRFNPLKYTDPSGHTPCSACFIPGPLPFFWLHFLCQEAGLDNPMAPAYLTPVAMGTFQKIRHSNASSVEKPEPALELTADWYWEIGENPRMFGPEFKVTQALMHDEGVEAARQLYLNNGRQDLRLEDRTAYDYKFGLRDAVRELGDVLSNGDWSTSFLGGYQVEIITLSEEATDAQVEFRVHNRTGWASATRVWGFSFKQDEDRARVGPGGNLDQVYVWRERIPKR